MTSDAAPEPTVDDLKRRKLRLEINALERKEQPWLRIAQPYLLLLFTAIISGLVVPYVARRSQISEKELEIKTELAGDISSAVASFFAPIQAFESRKVHLMVQNSDLQPVNEAFDRWQVEEGEIAARLHVYFPALAHQWHEFSKLMVEMYALTDTMIPVHRKDRVEKIKAHLPRAKVEWDTLATIGEEWTSVEQWRPYERAWHTTHDAVLQAKDEFIRKVIITPTTLR